MNKKARTYSIGIGSGARSDLVINTARAGLGQYTFISNANDIIGGIVTLLKSAIMPGFVEFDLKYNKQDVEYIIPDPKKIKRLDMNKPFNLFILFNRTVTKSREFTLTYKQDKTRKVASHTIKLDPTLALKSDNFTKLGID